MVGAEGRGYQYCVTESRDSDDDLQDDEQDVFGVPRTFPDDDDDSVDGDDRASGAEDDRALSASPDMDDSESKIVVLRSVENKMIVRLKWCRFWTHCYTSVGVKKRNIKKMWGESHN